MNKINRRIAVIVFLLLVSLAGVSFGQMGPMGRMGNMGIMDEFSFLERMIPHHQEAIEKATYLKEFTNRQEMRDFAESIIKVQGEEIAMMEKWIVSDFPERTREYQYEPMMRDYTGLQGDVLDKQFLEDMIPHHMEAVMMARQLLFQRSGVSDKVRNLAETIQKEQMAEIHIMMGWLNDWFSLDRSPMMPMGRGMMGSGLAWGGLIFLLVVLNVFQLMQNRRLKKKNQEVDQASQES